MDTKLSIREKLENYIIGMIESGEKNPGDRLPTEQELSDLFHVSRTTVIRALDNLEARKIINRRRGSGSYVAKKESTPDLPNIVSLILPFRQLAEMKGAENDILRGCQEYLNRHQYILSLSYTRNSFAEEMQSIDLCRRNRARGIIIYPCDRMEDPANYYSLLLDNYPIVFIDDPVDLPLGSYVLSDNIEGGYIAANHLFDTGCTALSFVTDIPVTAHETMHDRYYGFCRSVKEHGLALSSDLLFTVGEDAPACMNIVSRICFSAKGKKGIVCRTERLAEKIAEAAEKLDIAIPDELAVLCFNNTYDENCQNFTVISQNCREIGRAAAEELLRLIESPEEHRVLHKNYIKVKLIRGSST